MSTEVAEVLSLAAQHPGGIKLVVQGSMPGQLVVTSLGDRSPLQKFNSGQRLWIALQDSAKITTEQLESELTGPGGKRFKVTMHPICGKAKKATIDIIPIA